MSNVLFSKVFRPVQTLSSMAFLHYSNFLLRHANITIFLQIAVIRLQYTHSQHRKTYMRRKFVKDRILKRIFDLLVSSSLLIILSPVIVLIALLLKLESFVNPKYRGPVFFSEIRISRGKPFRIYKVSACYY